MFFEEFPFGFYLSYFDFSDDSSFLCKFHSTTARHPNPKAMRLLLAFIKLSNDADFGGHINKPIKNDVITTANKYIDLV